jgi:hypothetical protein
MMVPSTYSGERVEQVIGGAHMSVSECGMIGGSMIRTDFVVMVVVRWYEKSSAGYGRTVSYGIDVALNHRRDSYQTSSYEW